MIPKKRLDERRCATLQGLAEDLLSDAYDARSQGDFELEKAMTSLSAILTDAADDPRSAVQMNQNLIARALVLSVTFRSLYKQSAIPTLH
jgi:hypothetical protein